jgi:hypothetical protein
MTTFSLSIKMGNETMQSEDDISKALFQVAQKIKTGFAFGIIMDLNGNKVGEYSINED